jgi:electron transfer flavoprotein alpha subunit
VNAGTRPNVGTRLPAVVAVIVVNQGRLPCGAGEAVAEAGGAAVVVGRGAEDVGPALPGATEVWWADGEHGPAGWAARLAAALKPVRLLVLPASPDGRDLAPRLAASLDRPLLAGAVRVEVGADALVHAELLRADGRVVVPVDCAGPAVATLMPGVRSVPSGGQPPAVGPLAAVAAGRAANETTPAGTPPDPEVLALVEPDPATMDLADATRVLGGGAGLVPRGASDGQARAIFGLLAGVATQVGASMGATRVVTDAGWTGHQRQIGTTGVAIDPDLYVALGVSGATQHTGGLGAPRHLVSVNTDAACPMTAMANLGLVADATGLLLQLARHLDIAIPPELKEFDA